MKENGTVTTMQQVEEAVTRMRLLGCPQQIVHAFEDCRLVCICIPPDNRYLPTGDEVLERVHAFEEKYHAVVYSVIRSTTALGLMDSYLFVSDETIGRWTGWGWRPGWRARMCTPMMTPTAPSSGASASGVLILVG